MDERGLDLLRATVRPLGSSEDGVGSGDSELCCSVLKEFVNRIVTSWAPGGGVLGMEGKKFGVPTPSLLPVEALGGGAASDALGALPVGGFRRDSA